MEQNPLNFISVDDLASEIQKHHDSDLLRSLLADLRAKRVDLKEFCKRVRMLIGANVLVATVKGLQANQGKKNLEKQSAGPSAAAAPAAPFCPACPVNPAAMSAASALVRPAPVLLQAGGCHRRQRAAGPPAATEENPPEAARCSARCPRGAAADTARRARGDAGTAAASLWQPAAAGRRAGAPAGAAGGGSHGHRPRSVHQQEQGRARHQAAHPRAAVQPAEQLRDPA